MFMFCYGFICLNKVDLLVGKFIVVFDNILDWIVFQMVIIGGVGDFFGEFIDCLKLFNVEFNDQDYIVDWFVEFGFDGLGVLILVVVQKLEILLVNFENFENKFLRVVVMKLMVECEMRLIFSFSLIRFGVLFSILDSISVG